MHTRVLPPPVPPHAPRVPWGASPAHAHTCFCFGRHHYGVFTTVHFMNVLFILQSSVSCFALVQPNYDFKVLKFGGGSPSLPGGGAAMGLKGFVFILLGMKSRNRFPSGTT